MQRPKFMPGDLVKCVRSYYEDNSKKHRRQDFGNKHFTRHRVYRVIEYFPDVGKRGWVSIEKDNNGDSNGWRAEDFKLVERPKGVQDEQG